MDIDSLLHRPILAAGKFERLIPKIKCEFGFSGQGDTDLSIQNMEAVVLKFSGQMSKVANELKKSSLQDTVDEIFDFCYNYFQYKADEDNQMLRSPACSWSVRHQGIDCKSYSILASSILREMGISHYIRKIKQPFDPSDYSHVYVVVPADQKTGKLDQGYFVIDGTVYDNIEPDFVEKKDLFMQGLNHYSSLNAPRRAFSLGDPVGTSNGGTAPTTGSSTSGVNWSAVGNAAYTAAGNYVGSNSGGWLKKISFKNIGSIFKPCIGGSAFNEAALTRELDSITSGLTNILNQMNAAANDNNMEVFNAKVNEYIGVSGTMVFAAVAKEKEGWNGCSRANLQQVIYATMFYFQGTMMHALETWLDEYFISEQTNQPVYYTIGVLQARGIMPFCNWLQPAPPAFPVKYEKFTRKPGEIKGFVPTQYVYTNATTPQAFNPETFLGTLTEAYNTITNPGSIFNGGNGSSNNGGIPGGAPGTGGTTTTLPTPKPSQAGVNIVIGLLATAAIAYGATQFKNDPKKDKK